MNRPCDLRLYKAIVDCVRLQLTEEPVIVPASTEGYCASCGGLIFVSESVHIFHTADSGNQRRSLTTHTECGRLWTQAQRFCGSVEDAGGTFFEEVQRLAFLLEDTVLPRTQRSADCRSATARLRRLAGSAADLRQDCERALSEMTGVSLSTDAAYARKVQICTAVGNIDCSALYLQCSLLLHLAVADAGDALENANAWRETTMALH